MYLPNNKALFINYNWWLAFFLVWITPISAPLVIYLYFQSLITFKIVAFTIISYLATGLGITVGYHRLLTHRGFKTNPVIKFILLVFGSMALQGSPLAWATLHIQHHVKADKDLDPHSPITHSFWHAHCGWFFNGFKPNYSKYGKWLLSDPIARHVSKFYGLYALCSLVLPFILCGWVGLVVAGFFRIFLINHATWSVNSICHKWGSRPYKNVPGKSTNNFWLAIPTLGESWHNNHHKFIQSPNYSHKWYQLDIGMIFIILLKFFNLAWDLKTQPFKTN